MYFELNSSEFLSEGQNTCVPQYELVESMISNVHLNGTHEFMFLSVSLTCVLGEEHMSP